MFDKLDKLIEDINNNKEIQDFVKNYDKYKSVYLSDTVVVEKFSEKTKKLLEELDLELCTLFINDKGQLSREYYVAKNKGYRLRIGESDSFGPLSTIIGVNVGDKQWNYCFG